MATMRAAAMAYVTPAQLEDPPIREAVEERLREQVRRFAAGEGHTLVGDPQITVDLFCLDPDDPEAAPFSMSLLPPSMLPGKVAHIATIKLEQDTEP